MHTLALLALLVTQVPDPQEANPSQYAMSVGPKHTYGVVMSSGGAGDCRPFTVHGYYEDTLVLLPWGSQWTFVNETTSAATIYLMQTREATVADGLNAGGVTFDSATSCTSGTVGGAGESCRAMGASLSSTGYTQFKVSRGDWTCSGAAGARNPALCRTGRCTVVGSSSGPDAHLGGGCDTSAECGTGGTCSFAATSGNLIGPNGVYACVMTQATAGNIKLQRAGM